MLLYLIPSGIQAQWITNITVSPSNPTDTDTIYVYINCEFPSGNCNEHTQGITYSSNNIEAYALHCIGILTYICSATDTFIIPPLVSGTYNFKFQLDAGGLPSPCVPGINPGPSDSVQIIVSNTSAIPDQKENPDRFTILPGESPGLYLLKFPENYIHSQSVNVVMYSVTGNSVFSTSLTPSKNMLDLSALKNGVYFLQVNGIDRLSSIKILIPGSGSRSK